MSDQDNRKNALERLFQQKAEEYDISYNEDDWQELEERLDNLDQQRVRRNRRWLVAAAVVLTFSVLAYFTIENKLQINKLSNQISSTQHSEQTQTAINNDSDTGNTVESNPGESKSLSPRQNESLDRTVASDRQNQGSSNSKGIQAKTKRVASRSFENNPITEKAMAVSRAAPGFDGRLSAIAAIKPIETKTGRPA
ncbi:MAG TPA: hypothetical protein VJ964_07725, partial [Balneolaceae bacterium]|nr:hypothetical protein [Balneolaceae bacterium]